MFRRLHQTIIARHKPLLQLQQRFVTLNPNAKDDMVQLDKEARQKLDKFLKQTAPKAVDRPKEVEDSFSFKKGSIKYGSRAVLIIESISITFWVSVVFFCLYHITGGELAGNLWDNALEASKKSVDTMKNMKDKLDEQSDGTVSTAVSDMVKGAFSKQQADGYSKTEADQATRELLDLINASKRA